MRKYFIVNADHVSADYRATDKVVMVSEYLEDGRTLYYADASPYGCGKNAASIESAVRSLLSSNGCTNIRVGVEVTREGTPIA